MLFATAGCRFYISDRPVEPSGWAVADRAFVEIGETEALGLLGVSWELEDAGHVEAVQKDGLPIEVPVKAKMIFQPMPVIFGIDPLDPGQAVLWQAVRAADPYDFQLILPDGVTGRTWSALVIGLSEVFDAANSVVKLQADLKPTSDIQRIGAS